MLYVARHGETEWNAQNKVCGVTDIELTSKGKEQALALANIVKDKEIDIVISSPLKRAVETSELIAEVCNIVLKIDERLIEQNYGIYEGVDRRDKAFLNNKRNFAYRYPNGESALQVSYRIYGFLEEIKKEYKQQNVLLVSHGGVCRIINTFFNDMTNEEFFEYRLENVQLEEYEM